MMSSTQQIKENHLNVIKLSFCKAKIESHDKYLLSINFNIPKEWVQTKAKTYKVLHYLYHCLEQELHVFPPLPMRKGSYALSCNTLLTHKPTGDLRVFRQSFNASCKEYNALSQFAPLVGRHSMAGHIFRTCENEETLHDTINVPVSKDSDWTLIEVISIVVNVQVLVDSQQLSRIGMQNKRIKHRIVKKAGGILEDL